MPPSKKLTLPRVALVIVVALLAINVVAVAIVAIGNALRPPAGLEGIARVVTALDGVQGVRPGEIDSPLSDWVADGLVVMDPGATPDQVKEALDVTGAFIADQADDAALHVDAMNLQVGTTTMRVFPDGTSNAEQVVALSLLDDVRVDGAEVIGAGFYGDTVQLTIDSAAGLISGAQAARQLAAGVALYDHAPAVVRTVNNQYSFIAPPPVAAETPSAKVFAAVSDRFPLSSAKLTADAADLTLGFRATADDITAARTLARATAGDAIEVQVHGAFGDQGPDRAVRDLISATRSIDGVRDIGTGGDAGGFDLGLQVATSSAAYVAYAAVKDLPEFARLESFSVRRADLPNPAGPGDFRIVAAPADAPKAMALLNALSSTGIVRSVDLDYGEAGIDRDDIFIVELLDDSESSIEKAVAQLKSQFGGAAVVQLFSTDLTHAAQVGATFTIGTTIEPKGIAGDFRNQARSDQFQSTLTQAWND